MDGTTSPGFAVAIAGERVALGPGRRELVPLLYRWDNDFAMRRTQGGTPVAWTLEREYAAYDGEGSDPRHVSFIVYRRADWRPIGFTAWHDIDYRHGTASFVLGIGEAECRGQGYGTEATRLMLTYAFTTLGLHSALCTVHATNPQGLSAYRRAGFREFGRRRESHWMGGGYWDEIYLDCLSSEFSSPLLDQAIALGASREADPHKSTSGAGPDLRTPSGGAGTVIG